MSFRTGRQARWGTCFVSPAPTLVWDGHSCPSPLILILIALI